MRTYVVGSFWTMRVSSMVLLRAVFRPRTLESYSQEGPTRWGAAILRAAGVRVQWSDADRLRQRAQILIANHVSWFDIFVLAATLPVKYSIVGKQELARIPIFGAAWQKIGHYAVDRADGKAAAAALGKVAERIAADAATVVVFPEGTRSDSDRMGDFKAGAFVLAIKAQVPIVPVALLGTRPIMPKGSWVIRPGSVQVRVGEPIDTAGLQRTDRHALARRAREAVAGLLGEEDEREAAAKGAGAQVAGPAPEREDRRVAVPEEDAAAHGPGLEPERPRGCPAPAGVRRPSSS